MVLRDEPPDRADDTQDGIDMMKTLVAAAMMAGAMVPIVADAQAAAKLDGTRLDLSVRGEVTRVPDLAIISAGVVTQAQDARTALADNATKMSRVLAALRKAGIEPRDVSTSNISLSPQYRYVENQPPVITGYQANNSVTVRFRDIAKSGAILDTLVKEGANTINGPTLTIDKPDTALDEARAAAMKSARTRAELYARAAGLTVKRIVSISESGDGPAPQPYPVMMMARGDAAPKTEIAPGEQAIGVTLSISFELN
jgi:uncharacterized protein